MRYFLFFLLAVATFFTACQPVTPESIKTVSPNPKLSMNEAALLLPQNSETPEPPAMPEPMGSSAFPALSAPAAAAMPSETLSTDNVDQNSNRAKNGREINTITTNTDTENNASQKLSNITTQMAAISKTFNPKEIIGFATSMLVRDLGEATMIRQEGPVEVWQYQFASCVVDFFFFPSDKGVAHLIAKSWDMRSATMGDGLDRRRCRDEVDLYHRKIISNS